VYSCKDKKSSPTIQAECLLFPVQALKDTLADNLFNKQERINAMEGLTGVVTPIIEKRLRIC